MTDVDRTAHRLEAFSDIVIGFTLAEVGLGLTIPSNVAGLESSWPALNAFLFSFTLVSMTWWYHHKLFVRYLSLEAATVVMNFVLLGALALGMYYQQVTVHFLTLGIDYVVPLRAWMACVAAVVALLGGMYAVGIWRGRKTLDIPAMRWGVSLVYQSALTALGFAGFCVTFPEHRGWVLAIVLAVALAAAFRNRLALRITDLAVAHT